MGNTRYFKTVQASEKNILVFGVIDIMIEQGYFEEMVGGDIDYHKSRLSDLEKLMGMSHGEGEIDPIFPTDSNMIYPPPDQDDGNSSDAKQAFKK